MSSMEGYGRLTPTQKTEVINNQKSVDRAKTEVTTHIGKVKTKVGPEQSRQTGSINTLGQSILDFVKTKGEEKDLTGAQKKILSSVDSQIKDLKKQQAPLSKEIKVNQDEMLKSLKSMEKDVEQLKKLSQKVETLKNDPVFGRNNFIFGTSKQVRLEKAQKKADHAKEKAEGASFRVTNLTNLTASQSKVAEKIKALQTQEIDLISDTKSRLMTSKDVHVAINNAQKEYDKLYLSYTKRKEEFAAFKSTSKMFDGDRKEIKERLKTLEKHIDGLRSIENEMGKSKNYSIEEERVIRRGLNGTNREIGTIIKETQSLIKNAESNKMKPGERLSHVFGKLFTKEKTSNDFSVAEKGLLSTLYPGMSYDEAEKSYAGRHSTSETVSSSETTPTLNISSPTEQSRRARPTSPARYPEGYGALGGRVNNLRPSTDEQGANNTTNTLV